MTGPERPLIALTGASFGYGDQAVVTGVDLTIHAGERLAVVGSNGSGKSTLVKGILGLNSHLAGTVELFGTPMARFKERARIGYVPQRHTLSTAVAATAAEIVMSGRLPRLGLLARPGREDRRIVRESLALVGLGDRVEDEVGTLSGGQQRRVLIARALAGSPDVLVMDEPTAGVDAANQLVLAQVLQRLVDAGTTLLVVTHEMDALTPVLTRVVTVEGGRMRRDEPLHAASTRPGEADPPRPRDPGDVDDPGAAAPRPPRGTDEIGDAPHTLEP